jgi:hypothetical protein
MMHGVIETGLFIVWAMLVIGLIVFDREDKQKK